MGATADVKAYLDNLRPKVGQSVESFARSGLGWQIEIYSANAGSDIPFLEWDEINDEARSSWLEWARKRFDELGIKS